MKTLTKCLARLLLGVCLLLVATAARAQSRTVTGFVKDTKGEPVVGALVTETGTTNGSVTDIDGRFSVPNMEGTKLSVSFLGYQSQTVEIGGASSHDFVLHEDNVELGDVVVVGYGAMKRSDLTGSVVSVGAESIDKSVITSVDQVLQGRAAGVQIQQNSGTPGGSSSIRIRGINSLNASNEPIFVIDGVVIDNSTGSGTENPLASINPADIVSMDILKDASATAIYGARAANGVIMITTKRGQTGDANINYNGYVGWQQMPKKLELLDLREYAELKNYKATLGLLNPDNNFLRPELLGDGTDWQDELFETALMHSHNLSINGGNETITYSVSGGYLDQGGIAIGSMFRRVNVSAAVDAQARKWLKVGANVAFSNSKQKITVDENSLIVTALKQTPNVAVKNADGEYDGPDTDEYVQNNPVGLAKMKTNENRKTDTRTNVYLLGTIFGAKDSRLSEERFGLLTLKSEISLDYSVTNTYKFNPSYKFGAIKNDVNEKTDQKNYNRFWSFRNVLNWQKTFAERHSVNVMVGQEMQRSQWEWVSGYRSGFLSNTVNDLTMGDQSKSIADGSSGESKISSVFGRVFYSFDDRYLFTFTIRGDGSSNFAQGNQWGCFPSLALAWKFTKESFFPQQDVLTTGKLRLGWGKVGNQNVSAYSYAATLASTTTPWGSGLLPGNTANPELQWETTNSLNVGLDLSFLRNRIEFIGDYYYKKTDNLLLQLPLPSYLGTDTSSPGACSNPWGNIGALQNQGAEFTLNTVNIDKGSWSWRSNFVLSLNRNKVKEMDTETSTINKQIQQGSENTIVTRTAVGQPIGQFYGYKVKGRFNKPTDFYYIDQATGEQKQVPLIKGSKIAESDTWIGDLYYEDINGDGVITEDDRTFIGNPEPKFTWGFGNSFSWNFGLEFSFMLTGSAGNDVVNFQRRWLLDPKENTNLYHDALDYARVEKIDPAGPDNEYRNLHVTGGDEKMPRLATGSISSGNNRVFSDRYVEDGTYVRLSNVAISYSLKKEWVERIHLSNVKIYANFQNLVTLSKYSGYDPEIGSLNQDALMTGIDNGRYPSPRMYTVGLNVGF